MALLQKNIWTIFYILLAGAVLFLGIVSYAKWEDIEDEHTANQANLVKLIANATHSLFLSQEMTLNILGNHIIKESDPSMMDDLLVLNPSIVAFGFVDVDGNYLHVNSYFNKSKLPNLRQLAVTKDSFEYTLTQKKMVLGRTYFIAASGRWGIPIRKSIYDAEGKLQGVMTAGIAIEGAFKIFTDNLALGDYNKVMLIRDRDHFVQFQSSKSEAPKALYDTPLPSDFFNTLLENIAKKYELAVDELKQIPDIYEITTLNANEKRVKISLKYDNRYELWILSEIDNSHIVNDFQKNFFIYVFVFAIVHIVLFLLFKMIANAESIRKKDLIFQATHDTLTQLPNRSYLQQNIAQWIYEGAPPFSLYYLDMDHFKNINDSFGHQFGDLVLIEFAKRITKIVKKRSVVIRQGGDEFIILSYQSDDEELLADAQAMIHEISQPYHIQPFNFVIGASIGIAKYPEHGETLDMLLRASDIAMYEAKKYKNSVHLFNPCLQEGYLNRVNVEQALRTAISKHELFMVYHPQIDANSIIYGVEALVRWQSKELGLVPPDQFIPIAEASGFMPYLGTFIIKTALKEMKKLQTELGISFQTSLNISVKQFMQARFLETLLKEIEHVGLERVSLCLEITESLFIEDIDYILPILQKIHDMGLSISMDDFGTGYSSLSILRKLPIDELKIDKSFVDTILHDVSAEKMIQNIIAIGKNLDMYILAEGVETKEQESALKRFGCDRFQGYLYTKPLAYKALKEFFEKEKSVGNA